MYTTFHKMECHEENNSVSGDTQTEIPTLALAP
jgi:hypothetical protein